MRYYFFAGQRGGKSSGQMLHLLFVDTGKVLAILELRKHSCFLVFVTAFCAINALQISSHTECLLPGRHQRNEFL